MPIWLRNFTFKKIQDHYNKNNSNTPNEETWVKGKAVKAAQENSTKSSYPKFKV
jgi:hypothetical protein